MKSVIYYPYFEVQDENWLKFASLYVGKLTTIIPDEGRRYVSDGFEEIIDSKSFVEVTSSTSGLKNAAAEIAIKKIDSLLGDATLFTLGNKIENITINETQNYEIFSQKFPSKWLNYCIENNLGYKTDYGVKVSKEIAYIYMFALAELIGNKDGLNPITDNSKGQDFISGLYPENRGFELKEMNKESFAAGLINLKLPSKLDGISIREFLNLRNDEAFKKNQEAFHETLDLYINTFNNDYKSQYLDYINNMEADLKRWLSPTVATVATTVVYSVGGENLSSFIPSAIGGFTPVLIPDPGPSELNVKKKASQKFLTNIRNIEKH